MTVLGRLGHRLVAREVVNLGRLKWLAIVLPLAALLVLVLLLRSSLHDWLHESPGVLFLVALFAICVFAFASVIFALIEDLEARVLEQNRELSALLDVGRASSSSVGLADMLDEALAAILAVTPAEAAEVWLADGPVLTLARRRGAARTAFGSRTSVLVGEGLAGTAAQSSAPVVVHRAAVASADEGEEAAALGLHALCALPLRQRQETVGVLAIAARDARAFTSPEERRVLEGIAEQIALGVQNARLHERVLDRAVLEERERIARELHDGLAQVLGYINTQTLAVKKLLESGRERDASAELDAMAAVSREVYADVREAIVGLRTPPKGLVPAIRAYLSRVPGMDGCTVALHADEDAEWPALVPSAEIQLVRIVQEALSNVRRHAGASRVDVTVQASDESVSVEIADDGRGFDPHLLDRTGWPRLGLQTMRERAQALGGEFEVRSAPGQGTRIAVRVPVETGREAAVASAPR
ncbi:MAG TPA: GAF domain-containing sensor histidine kinase [Gaiellaceae bacterium]|nr:GAF domain-containing sensor histidine kinase [Gaiellaceae bacterium]